MVKIYNQGGAFGFPRRSKRLAWYVEVLCSRLMRQDQVDEESIRWFWDQIKKKQEELLFPWQRKNLAQEAKARLDNFLHSKGPENQS